MMLCESEGEAFRSIARNSEGEAGVFIGAASNRLVAVGSRRAEVLAGLGRAEVGAQNGGGISLL